MYKSMRYERHFGRLKRRFQVFDRYEGNLWSSMGRKGWDRNWKRFRRHQWRDSSVVERSPVKRMRVGSIPTPAL